MCQMEYRVINTYTVVSWTKNRQQEAHKRKYWSIECWDTLVMIYMINCQEDPRSLSVMHSLGLPEKYKT